MFKEMKIDINKVTKPHLYCSLDIDLTQSNSKNSWYGFVNVSKFHQKFSTAGNLSAYSETSLELN